MRPCNFTTYWRQGGASQRAQPRDEDCMNAISEDNLEAHTAKAALRWFLDRPALPDYLLRSLFREDLPY